MSVYLVALTREDEGAWERIRAAWPERHHFVNETLALISISKGISASSTISERVGISAGAESPSGMIIRIHAEDDIAGALSTSAVDWLKATDL